MAGCQRACWNFSNRYFTASAAGKRSDRLGRFGSRFPSQSKMQFVAALRLKSSSCTTRTRRSSSGVQANSSNRVWWLRQRSMPLRMSAEVPLSPTGMICATSSPRTRPRTRYPTSQRLQRS